MRHNHVFGLGRQAAIDEDGAIDALGAALLDVGSYRSSWKRCRRDALSTFANQRLCDGVKFR